MKRMLSMTLAMAFILLADGKVQAQDHPRERIGEAVKKYLDLTDQQLQQLLDLQESQRTTRQEFISRPLGIQKQMMELLKLENPDPAQLGALVLQRLQLQKQIKAAHDALHVQALALLTTAQKEKVGNIKKAMEMARWEGPLEGLGLLEATEGGPRPGNLEGMMGSGQGPGPGPGGSGPRGHRDGGKPGSPGHPPVN